MTRTDAVGPLALVVGPKYDRGVRLCRVDVGEGTVSRRLPLLIQGRSLTSGPALFRAFPTLRFTSQPNRYRYGSSGTISFCRNLRAVLVTGYYTFLRGAAATPDPRTLFHAHRKTR